MQDYQFIAPFYDFLLYPFVKSIRRDVLKLVQGLQPKLILDVACGTGDQLRLLSENNFPAVGVDRSAAMLMACRKNNPSSDCLLQDATAMAFQDNTFDLAMISFALHETGWNFALEILGETSRILRPSGHLLVVDYSDFSATPPITRQFIRLIEFMAGRQHYSNFLRYHHNGGLKSLIDEKLFTPMRTKYRGSRSITIRLYQLVTFRDVHK